MSGRGLHELSAPVGAGGPGARVLTAERRPWRRVVIDGGIAHVVGDPSEVDGLVIKLAAAKDDAAREAILNAADFLFAAIIETPDMTTAACDLVRSTPVYFGKTDNGWLAGNDARSLAERLTSRDLDRAALLEIEMAGYATGGATAYADLRVLEPGSFIVLENSGEPMPRRYFRYMPDLASRHLVTSGQLGEIVDCAFVDLIRRARGREIVVPVSGGLDSRLVLAKLAEHGCAGLTCFSYGSPGNTDARAGREVAERLGVPWRFVPSRGSAHRAFFGGQAGRDFWRFADGLACVPSPQDIVPFSELKAADALDSESIVVNGQTGDFLSGGHIPSALSQGDITREAFLAVMTSKHYGLWRGIGTSDRLRMIESRIEAITGALPPMLPMAEAIARYELWEYEARQSAWVVHAQRTYEYLGLDWQLPLWDPRLIRFFRSVPLDDKIGQRLYREFLAKWNYKGLFAGFSRARSTWTGWSRPLAVLEKGARLLGAAPLQQRVNATLRYFGHYRHQYAELSFREFWRVRHSMRHILAHQSRSWLKWNGFPTEGVEA